MSEADLPEFTALLDSICSMITSGRYMPNELSTELFFNALSDHSLSDVRKALDRHVRVSKFPPTPAEVLSYLDFGDGRPGAEEAWATALQAADEAATVVWTAETATAWGVARVVFDRGDEVGARMAFKEVYTREVATARQAGIRPAWAPSLGYDPARRDDALRVAVEKGLLQGTGADDLLHLAAPRAPVPLLESAMDLPDWAPDAKEHIKAIRARLTAPRPDSAARSLVERQRAADRTAALRAKVDAYAAERGIDLGSAVPAPGEPQ